MKGTAGLPAAWKTICSGRHPSHRNTRSSRTCFTTNGEAAEASQQTTASIDETPFSASIKIELVWTAVGAVSIQPTHLQFEPIRDTQQWKFNASAARWRFDGGQPINQEMANARAILASFLAAALAAACGPGKKGSASSLKLRFPEAGSAALASKVGGFSWNLACFSVNVLASDIPARQPTCSPPIGAFQGAAAPGSELVVSVPNGSRRRLEIFAYVRTTATSPCPALDPAKGFQGLDLGRVVRVSPAEVFFDALTPEVSIDVQLTLPATPTDVVEQYGLAASCRPAAPASGPGSSRVILGAATSTGVSGSGVLSAIGTVSAQKNEITLTGAGGLEARLSRIPQ